MAPQDWNGWTCNHSGRNHIFKSLNSSGHDIFWFEKNFEENNGRNDGNGKEELKVKKELTDQMLWDAFNSWGQNHPVDGQWAKESSCWSQFLMRWESFKTEPPMKKSLFSKLRCDLLGSANRSISDNTSVLSNTYAHSACMPSYTKSHPLKGTITYSLRLPNECYEGYKYAGVALMLIVKEHRNGEDDKFEEHRNGGDDKLEGQRIVCGFTAGLDRDDFKETLAECQLSLWAEKEPHKRTWPIHPKMFIATLFDKVDVYNESEVSKCGKDLTSYDKALKDIQQELKDSANATQPNYSSLTDLSEELDNLNQKVDKLGIAVDSLKEMSQRMTEAPTNPTPSFQSYWSEETISYKFEDIKYKCIQRKFILKSIEQGVIGNLTTITNTLAQMRAISQIELMKITRQNVEFQIELMKTAQLSAENAANQMRMLISDLRGVTSTAAENAERAANRMLGLIDDLKRQTTAAANIAEKAAQDTSAMKIIAILTALFLPGTFFAILFTIPTWKWDEDKVIGRHFWVYWYFTGPTTFILVTGFVIWFIFGEKIGKRLKCDKKNGDKEELDKREGGRENGDKTTSPDAAQQAQQAQSSSSIV